MRTEKVSTIIRLRPELLDRAKRMAKRSNLSFNAFVEKVLDCNCELEWPVLPPDFKVSDEILNLACFKLPKPTQEELDNDSKYAYLYEKYIKE